MTVYMYNNEAYTEEALYNLLINEITEDDIMELVFPQLRPDTYFLFEYFSDEYKVEFRHKAIERIMSGEEEITRYHLIEI